MICLQTGFKFVDLIMIAGHPGNAGEEDDRCHQSAHHAVSLSNQHQGLLHVSLS